MRTRGTRGNVAGAATRRKFTICKPLGLSSIRNDTSSAPSQRLTLYCASYESAKWLGQEFTRKIREMRCGNVRKIRATSAAAFRDTRDALTRINCFPGYTLDRSEFFLLVSLRVSELHLGTVMVSEPYVFLTISRKKHRPRVN